MKYELNGVEYDVVVIKKNNKNLYIRVKEDMKIYVTCNYFTTKKIIENVLNDNKDSLKKMMLQVKKKIKNSLDFCYLGKNYNVVFDNDTRNVKLLEDSIIVKDQNMLDKWYKNEIENIFDDRYIYVFNHFDEDIKSPILKIRTMKTRWGVYNRKNHTITLNSKLIEYDVSKIDYVIIHELSHILYFNHSKKFWNLVSKYCPNYKDIRKEMK